MSFDHYHLGRYRKDNTSIHDKGYEVAIYPCDDGTFVVDDEWEEFDEHHDFGDSRMFIEPTLLEAIKKAGEVLRERIPDGYFVRGAGAPPDELLKEAGLI